MAGLTLVSLLAVAGSLQPSPAGLGTHEQLGLPSCTFRWLFGMRCPSCGMTTSWSHAMRGQWCRSDRECRWISLGNCSIVAVAPLVRDLAAVRGGWLVQPA